MSYQFRDNDPANNCRITCPEHGVQQCYTLFGIERGSKKIAAGCEQCHQHLPVLGKAEQNEYYRMQKTK